LNNTNSSYYVPIYNAKQDADISEDSDSSDSSTEEDDHNDLATPSKSPKTITKNLVQKVLDSVEDGV
jgi:hypothetical protein